MKFLLIVLVAIIITASCNGVQSLTDDPKVPGANGKVMSSGQCSFNTAEGLHYDISALKKSGGEDYKKIIQVGPNIQFIYRMNLCANTLVNCQNEPAPATEALKIPAGVNVCLAPSTNSTTPAGNSCWVKNQVTTIINPPETYIPMSSAC